MEEKKLKRISLVTASEPEEAHTWNLYVSVHRELWYMELFSASRTDLSELENSGMEGETPVQD